MGRARLALLLCAVVASLAIPGQICAQQQYQLGKIIGNVRVTKGDFPRYPVLISLEMRGSPIENSYCDDQGRFGFYNLVANEYRVSVDDDSYEPFSATVNVDPALAVQNFVEIRLTPRVKDKKGSPDGRLEGSNPYLVDPAVYLSHFPKKTLKEFDKGREADQRGSGDDAIQHYLKALSYSPDFYPAHNNLGSAYLARQNFGAAQAEFEAALKANQNDAEAYFNLANVLLTTRRYPDAERDIEEGLQRRPDSPFGHFLQGLLYSRTNRPELAEKSLQTALRFDPKMSQAYLQLVNLYLQQKRTVDAVAQLESYLKTFPDTPFSPKARDLLKRLQAETDHAAK